MDKLSEAISNPRIRESLARRMRAKVEIKGDDDCWEWTSKAATHNGYGRINAGRAFNFKSHRVAWALEHGPIPEGLCVLHRCDNPPCCNPRHLFLGTHADNTQDMLQKERDSKPPIRYGENHHNAKFGAKEAEAIASDMRPAHVIAAEYGVSAKTIYRIRKGKSWLWRLTQQDSTLSRDMNVAG